jgi:hypothetical protein
MKNKIKKLINIFKCLRQFKKKEKWLSLDKNSLIFNLKIC